MVRLVANVDHIRTVVRQPDISATVGHVICVHGVIRRATKKEIQ